MNKKSIYKNDIETNIGLSIMLIVLFGIGAGALESIQTKPYRGRANSLAPELTRQERKMVMNAGDSTLDARMARYKELCEDYSETKDVVSDFAGPVTFMRKKFSDEDIITEFSEELGVDNLKEYKNYLRAYERDSLEARMRAVYRDRVRPQKVMRNAHVRDSLRRTK